MNKADYFPVEKPCRYDVEPIAQEISVLAVQGASGTTFQNLAFLIHLPPPQ